MAIVPTTGKGTFADPIRPQFAPLPTALNTKARSGILGFSFVLSDDGKYALVEYVARDHSAIQPILATPSVKSFSKGKDTRASIEAEFKKYKKDFDITHFGVRMP